MITNLSYVKWIQEYKITIFCEDQKKEPILKGIGAKRKLLNRKHWVVECKDEGDLANKLQILNDNRFMFAGGSSGWNPVDIYILMRGKALVCGNVTEVVWVEHGRVTTRTL